MDSKPAQTVAAVLFLGFILAACSAPAAVTASAPAASTDQPSATVAATPTATVEAISTNMASAHDAPISPHEVPDLEALLPDSVNGIALIKASRHGTADDEFASWATLVGKNFADLDSAVATDFTTTRSIENFLEVQAVRIRGVEADRVETVVVRAMQQYVPPPTSAAEGSKGGEPEAPSSLSNGLVGNKQVLISETPGHPTGYTYASGEVLYLVLAADQDLAAALLAALP